MRSRKGRRIALLAAMASLLLGGLATLASGSSPRVLLVCNDASAPAGCSYHSIQAAVNAAAPGDWVLVWPGVYHEKGNVKAGVYITTPGIHLRGLDRNGVIVDGTNPGGQVPCSSDPALQDLNAAPGQSGTGRGRNGIEVYKADGTYIESLTVCNYLSGTGGQGNEIWWNGGDGSGKIGLGSYWGNYLTASSTYFKDGNSPMGMYAIFSSNDGGPASINHTYGSNMGDSAYYIGACQRVCNQTINDGHAENSALGFSGTNAGGNLVIENSEWDQNRAGIVPNSLNNDDAPPPQDGRCVNSSQSCTLIEHNYVHDNNNPNVPGSGIAGEGPIGAGIELPGASYNTIAFNRVEHQDGWGIVTHEFPDTETPPSSGLSHCQGGTEAGAACNFPSAGNLVHDNTFKSNGGFGNPSNGDLATTQPSQGPHNCFYGNVDPGGLTSDPPNIQQVDGPPCNSSPGAGDDAVLGSQLVCASGLNPAGSCPGSHYPAQTKVRLLPIPAQPTMPNPCAGVPNNPWCQSGQLTHALPSSAGLYPLIGRPVGACVAIGQLKLRLRHPRGQRIVAVKVFVNGRLVLRARGYNLKRVKFGHPRRGRFNVRIVLRMSNGHTVTMRRHYRSCPKGPPHAVV